MPLLRSRTARTRLLGLTLMAATTIAACAPAANTLPTALPGAGKSAQPTGASGGADPSGPLPSGVSADPFVAWPAFAACLRAHGANIADPVLDAGGSPQWGDDLKQYITEPIRDACSPIIAAVDEGGTLKGDRNRPTFTLESELANAACMRAHGLPTWPDPLSTGDTGTMPEGFDKADPTVYAALVACEPLLVETTASPSPGL